MSRLVNFADIDFNDPRITPLMELAIRRMMDIRERYAYEGRDLEARGVGVGIWVTWNTLVEEYDPRDGSSFGGLNG
jgi:hypothetical protein